MNTPNPSRPTLAEPRASAFEGWYDSSLDLQRGLVVTEHGSLDPLGDETAASPASPASPIWRPESLTRWIRSAEGAPR